MHKSIFRAGKRIENISIKEARKYFVSEYLSIKWDNLADIYIDYYTNGEKIYCLKIYLSLYSEEYEFAILYKDKTDGRNKTVQWFPVKDENTLTEWRECREDLYARKGTFMSPEETWLIVEEFLKTGQMTDKIRWIKGEDLPEPKTPYPGGF